MGIGTEERRWEGGKREAYEILNFPLTIQAASAAAPDDARDSLARPMKTRRNGETGVVVVVVVVVVGGR